MKYKVIGTRIGRRQKEFFVNEIWKAVQLMQILAFAGWDAVFFFND